MCKKAGMVGPACAAGQGALGGEVHSQGGPPENACFPGGSVVAVLQGSVQPCAGCKAGYSTGPPDPGCMVSMNSALLG